MSRIPDHEFSNAVNGKRSRVDAEQEADADPHDLVRKQEKDRRDSDHHEHHDRGDRGLLARRPSDLLSLGAHFLQELEWTDLRHRSIQIGIPRPPLRRRPTPRILFGECSPRMSVTGPLTMDASYCRPGAASSYRGSQIGNGPRSALCKSVPDAYA